MTITRNSVQQTIRPQELFERMQRGERIEIIDVRTPVEFREVHIEPARNIPLDLLDVQQLKAEGLGTNQRPLYVVCRTGNRAAKACEKFLAAGLENVFLIEGGTLGWVEAGLPVKRGKKAISLERQVRIAAGTLVLLGVVLGFTVHPAFYGLAAFVGAGLVFAGITDTCAMGMLLAKMPWNRVGTFSDASMSNQSKCSLEQSR